MHNSSPQPDLFFRPLRKRSPTTSVEEEWTKPSIKNSSGKPLKTLLDLNVAALKAQSQLLQCLPPGPCPLCRGLVGNWKSLPLRAWEGVCVIDLPIPIPVTPSISPHLSAVPFAVETLCPQEVSSCSWKRTLLLQALHPDIIKSSIERAPLVLGGCLILREENFLQASQKSPPYVSMIRVTTYVCPKWGGFQWLA